MNWPISKIIWQWIAFAWFCLEVGQFIEARFSLGHNFLFWPFWICFWLVLLLGGYSLDLWKEHQSSRHYFSLQPSENPLTNKHNTGKSQQTNKDKADKG